MTKVINAPLEEITELAKRLKGKKAYIIGKGNGLTDRGDILISAVLDVNQVIYNSEEKFGFYDYEIADKVHFDRDNHPHWNAYFGKEHFKLYDGIFLGHHGCGGHDKYVRTIEKAKSDLSSINNYKGISRQFKKFHKRYMSEKESMIADSVRARFSISEGKKGRNEFAQYLHYEDDKDRDILFFWEWFCNNFIDEKEYEKKIKEITGAGHKKAFESYICSIVTNLKNSGFKRVER
ncbi:hypothetical protein HYT26_04390 [Candidatus Pacearchaeota archaeon]|nr:hypothetical protein [Candidatus Pacearchaeota archaeon]